MGFWDKTKDELPTSALTRVELEVKSLCKKTMEPLKCKGFIFWGAEMRSGNFMTLDFEFFFCVSMGISCEMSHEGTRGKVRGHQNN